VLSEGAASLLPGQDRPAFIWRFDLDADGQVERFTVVRALVRSRARLDYAQVQAAADGGTPAGPTDGLAATDLTEQAALLREIGTRRIALERARGGASLPLPEQEVVAEDGGYRLTLRGALPAEDWNAQLSLMTGMAAARLMLDAGVGILRTLPAPDGALVARLRRQARALSVPWPDGQPHGELLAGLDRSDPAQLTLLHAAGSLFRGAGYTALAPGTEAAGEAGAEAATTTHAAVAAPYAHVTAPLRRLVDRFGLVVAHSLCSGRPVPGWVLEALPELPAVMAASDQLAGRFERACLDTVEAAVLSHRVGEVFEAVVVDVSQPKDGSAGTGKVQLLSPAVLASCAGPLERGTNVRVRLVEADPGTGTVRFAPEAAPAAAPGVAAEAAQG
jgi:exoribonuclease R